MKRALAVVLMLAFISGPAIAQTPRPVIDFSGAVEKLRPSLVTLSITKAVEPWEVPPAVRAVEKLLDTPPSLPERKEGGAGFVFDAADGLIVTSDFLVVGAKSIDVVLASGEVRVAQVLGADPESGVGLIRIAAGGLTDLAWSDRAVREGEPVLAYGSVNGRTPVARSGVVASVDPAFYAVDPLFRSGNPAETIRDGEAEVMLLDMATYNGSAGGLVVDQSGAVVGMTTGLYGSVDGDAFNFGVAVPASEVRRIALLLERDGKVERGRIGLAIQHEPARGVIVAEVVKNSPAERAGLKIGDVIRSAAGQPMKNDRILTRLMARQPIGATVPMTIERDGRTIDVSLTVERRTDN